MKKEDLKGKGRELVNGNAFMCSLEKRMVKEVKWVTKFLPTAKRNEF